MAKNGAKPANESIEQIRDIIFGEEKRIRHPADRVHIPEKDFSLEKNHLLLGYNQTVDLVI